MERETSRCIEDDEIRHALDVTYKNRISVNYFPAFANYQRHFYVLCGTQIVKGTLSAWSEHLRKLSRANKHDWVNLL